MAESFLLSEGFLDSVAAEWRAWNEDGSSAVGTKGSYRDIRG